MSAVIEISKLTNNASGKPNDDFLKLRPFSVKEYDWMIEQGILTENDNIELLNGAIVEKMPKGTKHSAANDRVARVFYRVLGDKAIVRNQNPIWLDDFSEPEPDIVLAALNENGYEDKHPTPEDIFLILEVSDSTLSYDRTAKSTAYARAGIQQYLLLNVQDGILEDYREPSADGYQSKQTLRVEQTFNLVAFPDVILQAKDFLPIEKI
ncbi:MAG TPA: Uma2 family endonuclease [Pyrinomonadaceae bacterium]|jgi:Uma2 family endonuclease